MNRLEYEASCLSRQMWLLDQRTREKVAHEKGIQEGIQEGIQKGFQRGKLEEKREMARSMLKYGLAADKVKDISNLSMVEVIQIQKEVTGAESGS